MRTARKNRNSITKNIITPQIFRDILFYAGLKKFRKDTAVKLVSLKLGNPDKPYLYENLVMTLILELESRKELSYDMDSGIYTILRETI